MIAFALFLLWLYLLPLFLIQIIEEHWEPEWPLNLLRDAFDL